VAEGAGDAAERASGTTSGIHVTSEKN